MSTYQLFYSLHPGKSLSLVKTFTLGRAYVMPDIGGQAEALFQRVTFFVLLLQPQITDDKKRKLC